MFLSLTANYFAFFRTWIGTVPARSVQQYLQDSLGGTAVPTLRQGAGLPVAADHLADSLSKAVGVFAHKDVGTLGDGLLMLGVAVEGDAGHAVEGRLLSHVTAVGDDAAGMGGEPTELEVRE